MRIGRNLCLLPLDLKGATQGCPSHTSRGLMAMQPSGPSGATRNQCLERVVNTVAEAMRWADHGLAGIAGLAGGPERVANLTVGKDFATGSAFSGALTAETSLRMCADAINRNNKEYFKTSRRVFRDTHHFTVMNLTWHDAGRELFQVRVQASCRHALDCTHTKSKPTEPATTHWSPSPPTMITSMSAHKHAHVQARMHSEILMKMEIRSMQQR